MSSTKKSQVAFVSQHLTLRWGKGVTTRRDYSTIPRPIVLRIHDCAEKGLKHKRRAFDL